MLRSYLLIAFRSLLKNKLFSFINILSLSLSITLCMMTMLKTMDTLSYDTFHHKKDRIYRITSEIHSNDGRDWTLASTPLPLLQKIKDDAPAIERAVHLYPTSALATDGVKEISLNGAFTNSDFFTIFDFELEYGDGATALIKPNSIVLTKSTAEKFFEKGNALGQMISLQRFGEFMVTGIIKNSETKSHIDFEAYFSSATIPQLEREKKLPVKLENWDSFENAYTYVLLKTDSDTDYLNDRLASITNDINKGATSGKFILRSQALSSITPGTDEVFNDIGRGGSWGKIFAECGVAFIILLAACFNYTNLSIARALTRMKEVAIRKVAGAKRKQIFFQYIVESIVVAIFALGIALVLISFILEYQPFNDGYETVPVVQLDLFLVSCFFAFAVVAGILAGSLPAWILSSFKAIRLMKNIAVEKIMSGITLRKVLLVFQFTISITVLIFLTVFYRQFAFMASADPGYRTKNVITIPFAGKERDAIVNEFLRLAGVESITSVSMNFGRAGDKMTVSRKAADSQPFKMNYYNIDSALTTVSELRIVAGENVGSGSHDVLLNRKATEVLNFTSPFDAVGDVIWIEDSVAVKVTGVVEDFYYEGVGNAIQPLVLVDRNSGKNFLSLLVTPGQEVHIVPRLEQSWKKVFPDRAFTFSWLDHDYRERHNQRASISFLGFLSFMTIAIAALGLLGLVVYTVETKRKEIGIRKIIGAEVGQLLVLLSRGFVKLLLIAGFIAVPLGYLAGEFFLMNFANRISVGAGSLLSSFAFLLALGLSMIVSQTYKAAVENPVNSLRSE